MCLIMWFDGLVLWKFVRGLFTWKWPTPPPFWLTFSQSPLVTLLPLTFEYNYLDILVRVCSIQLLKKNHKFAAFLRFYKRFFTLIHIKYWCKIYKCYYSRVRLLAIALLASVRLLASWTVPAQRYRHLFTLSVNKLRLLASSLISNWFAY